MSITLELSPELENRLRREADQQGRPVEALLQAWIEEKTAQRSGSAVPDASQSLVEVLEAARKRTPDQRPTADEIVAHLEELAQRFNAQVSPPDEAYRRENLYEDRW